MQSEYADWQDELKHGARRRVSWWWWAWLGLLPLAVVVCALIQ